MGAVAAGSEPLQKVPNDSSNYTVTYNQTFQAVESALSLARGNWTIHQYRWLVLLFEFR